LNFFFNSLLSVKYLANTLLSYLTLFPPGFYLEVPFPGADPFSTKNLLSVTFSTKNLLCDLENLLLEHKFLIIFSVWYFHKSTLYFRTCFRLNICDSVSCSYHALVLRFCPDTPIRTAKITNYSFDIEIHVLFLC